MSLEQRNLVFEEFSTQLMTWGGDHIQHPDDWAAVADQLTWNDLADFTQRMLFQCPAIVVISGDVHHNAVPLDEVMKYAFAIKVPTVDS